MRKSLHQGTAYILETVTWVYFPDMAGYTTVDGAFCRLLMSIVGSLGMRLGWICGTVRMVSPASCSLFLDTQYLSGRWFQLWCLDLCRWNCWEKEKTKSGYTREKICNLNDHCNDDCNSSLEWLDLHTREKICNLNDDCNSSLECKFSRGGRNLYIKHVCANTKVT